MYQTLIDFLNFIGVTGDYPETLGDFICWFIMVIVCVCIIRFVINSFFAVVNYVRRGN